MSKIHILGVPLDILTPLELERSIRKLLYRRRSQITTPNPEFLLLAQIDQEFFSVLEQATLSIPDGIGLKFAGWLKGVNLKRYTGSNLLLYLLRLADQKHLRVAVVNWRGGLSNDEDILQAVKLRHPHLKFFVFSIERDGKGYRADRLRNFRPDIIFTTLGAPYQDIFIRQRILKDVFSIRLAMGVGGSFDFITGKVKRAPRIFQIIGLEWFWRLVLQPLLKKQKNQQNVFSLAWRLKRIYNAVVVFSFKVLTWELRRFFYRRNVVALIVNKNNETLILDVVGRGHYWGLPQGGVEKGETLEQAVWREIEEETGLAKLTIKASFPNTYQYTWPKHYTRRGYKGQRQSFFIMQYDGLSQVVKLNPREHKAYRWVKLEHLTRSASPVHRQQYEVFLNKYYEVIAKKN